MKVLLKDLRRGVLKIRAENLDDIWYLSQIIVSGDMVRGEAERRVKDREDVRSSGGERKVVTLGVRVEKMELKGDTGTLRVSGTIEDGPEDIVALGSHQTLNVELGSVVSVTKPRWSDVALDMVKNAVNSTVRPRVLVVAVDEGEATLGLLRESGIQFNELSRNVGGKYDLKGREERKKAFYRELASMIENMAAKENVSTIVLAGAGFEKDNFLEYLKGANRELAGRCVVENTGSSGRNAVGEVIKRPALRKTIKEANSARDIRLVDELLTNIGKDSGLATYGLPDVEAAVNAGAVDVLLVSDSIFFKERSKLEDLMNSVVRNRGVFHILNQEGEAGKQLESIGGVAALLRYKLSY